MMDMEGWRGAGADNGHGGVEVQMMDMEDQGL
jgi:hypothetical protein